MHSCIYLIKIIFGTTLKTYDKTGVSVDVVLDVLGTTIGKKDVVRALGPVHNRNIEYMMKTHLRIPPKNLH
jgi:hypothetical protein